MRPLHFLLNTTPFAATSSQGDHTELENPKSQSGRAEAYFLLLRCRPLFGLPGHTDPQNTSLSVWTETVLCICGTLGTLLCLRTTKKNKLNTKNHCNYFALNRFISIEIYLWVKLLNIHFVRPKCSSLRGEFIKLCCLSVHDTVWFTSGLYHCQSTRGNDQQWLRVWQQFRGKGPHTGTHSLDPVQWKPRLKCT